MGPSAAPIQWLVVVVLLLLLLLLLHFWKYVSNFKRKDNSFIQLKMYDQFVTDPKHIADEFATYFESIFNTSCQSVNPADTVTSDFLPTAPISAA
jgi:ABC-type spermidine/putrescine transport system permease subunit I